MNHRLTRLAATSFLLATAPAVFAETTIIHAGELLAIPGKAANVKQTIVPHVIPSSMAPTGSKSPQQVVF